jgi:hypothetical protein
MRKRARRADIPEIWDSKGWRKGVAILCVAYCLVAWVLPVAVLVVFRELPYLHERRFLERLVTSAAGTGVLVVAMAISFPRRFLIYRESTWWKTAESVLLAVSGLAMFTAAAAALSGNLFGALTKLMPGTPYLARFIVSELESSLSRGGVSLSLKPKEGTMPAYLTLSRRLFGRQEIRVGDEMVLRGKQNMAGVYVDDFEIVSFPRSPFP